ncbi:MAG: GIY-YIG nuclease family protein [Chloroflexota bacterium]
MTRAWVYMLCCADGSYYTGHTTDLERRLAEHQAGRGSEWTKHRLPVELVFAQEMPDVAQALSAERQIKGWTRAKKQALISRDWDLVHWLAQKPAFRQPHHDAGKRVQKEHPE